MNLKLYVISKRKREDKNKMCLRNAMSLVAAKQQTKGLAIWNLYTKYEAPLQIVQEILPKLTFLKYRSKPYSIERKVSSQVHVIYIYMKYEIPITQHAKVMSNVKVSDRQIDDKNIMPSDPLYGDIKICALEYSLKLYGIPITTHFVPAISVLYCIILRL